MIDPRLDVGSNFISPSRASLMALTHVSFLEGPAADADGVVYFSDIRANRLMRYQPDGRLDVFREDAGRANGNVFDARGRLITCEGGQQGIGGRRRVVRTDLATGHVVVLASHYLGKRLNSPNDVTVDRRGSIYFTDPRYGLNRDDLELEIEGIYRVSPSGEVTLLVAQPEVQRPNGLAISPDDRTLYVVDSNEDLGGNRKIWAFDLLSNGSLANQRVVFDFSPGRGADGIEVDVEGRIWACAGVNTPRSDTESPVFPAGVYVIDPAIGEFVGWIRVPQDLVTNCCFGGPDLSLLYVTAGHVLYRVETATRGAPVFPRHS